MATFTAAALPAVAAQLRNIDGPIGRIAEALVELATDPHTPDQTSFLFAVFGGFGVGGDADLQELISLTLQRIGDPHTNPGLRSLPQARQDEIRALVAQYAAYDRDFAPRQLLAEAAGAADIDCPHPSDKEH
ncbi:hypothetical protein [Streptomyces nigrescens]|uniref:hypothetical protein n=1 Tax=Streptomyces nigrescens TaxID=1920 RepID=UPI0036B7DF04